MTLELALQLHQKGQLEAAEKAYRDLLASRPEDASILHLLAMLLFDRGHHASAIDLVNRAIAIDPYAAHFHSNLAGMLGKLGRPKEAVEHLREAIRLDPNFPEAHNNLGVALEAMGKWEEALAAYQTAIHLRPNYAEAHSHMGHVLQRLGPISESVAAIRKAIALKPDYADAYGNLAAALAEMGKLDESIAYCHAVVALRPHSPRANSDLLFMLLNHADYSPQTIYELHQVWAERHAKRYYADHAHPNVKVASRRLRLGYVSADFRAHPVTRFLEPVLRNHNHLQFEVYCYSDVAEPDNVTQRLRLFADVWRDTNGKSDEQVTQLIRSDSIDILVDLAGHMSPHRLLVFARKPAPIQVTYLGYPNTTGLKTMDYRITDEQHDPTGETEAYHSEQLVRLNPCCWSYHPDDYFPDVNRLPELSGNGITFGALNRLAKVTPQMMALWAEILREVPKSHLAILVAPGSENDPSLRRLFEFAGLPTDRLTLMGRTTRSAYLRRFNSIDILLDTFPYNGHTTTCDALWMGVPVVSLAGKTHVARAGLSVLSAVGLRELVAHSPQEYVAIAVALAEDLGRLSALRVGLRDRLMHSPLLDAKGFTSRFEEAFRAMWMRGCKAGQTSGSI
jgi:protein O-GlcNAc transferase